MRVRVPPRPPRRPLVSHPQDMLDLGAVTERGSPMSTTPHNWKYSVEDLRAAVCDSTSLRQVLARLGLSKQGGGAYATLNRRIKALELDTSHFTGQGWRRGQTSWPNRRMRPLEELLVESSPVTCIHRLKRRLIREGLLETRCQICGLGDEWNYQPLVLRFDHINGVRNDMRIENLRLICPNCDSQLPTFAGRNRRHLRETAPPHASSDSSAAARLDLRYSGADSASPSEPSSHATGIEARSESHPRAG